MGSIKISFLHNLIVSSNNEEGNQSADLRANSSATVRFAACGAASSMTSCVLSVRAANLGAKNYNEYFDSVGRSPPTSSLNGFALRRAKTRRLRAAKPPHSIIQCCQSPKKNLLFSYQSDENVCICPSNLATL